MTNLDAKITNFNTSVINTVDYLNATEKMDVVSMEDMIKFLRESLTSCIEECLGYSMNIPDCFIVEKGKLEKTRIKNDFDPATVRLIKYADFSTWLKIEIGFYIDDNTDKVVVGRDRILYSLTIPIEVKAGNNSHLRSLHSFVNISKQHVTAVRIWSGNFFIQEAETPAPDNHPYTLINVPFYYAGQIATILKQVLESK